MDLFGHPAYEAPAADVLALVGDAIVSTDECGRILLFNRAAEETFGYRTEEVLGEPVENLLPQRFRQHHKADVRAFAEGAEGTRRIMGHRREVSGRRKNGEEFPVEATVSRQSLFGRTTLTVVIRDISERKRIEQELEARNRVLEASEGRLRLALKGGRMGIWEWNLKTNAVVADAAARRLWGLPERRTLQSEHALERVHHDDLPQMKEALEDAIEESTEFRLEFRIICPDDTVRWVASKAVVLYDSRGEPEVMSGVTFDITERREIEEQRRLISSELSRRMKNMMALVSSVVALSARNADTVETYKQSLQGPLGAISETHSLLVESGWSSTTLIEQLLFELEAYRSPEGTNIVLDGPAIAFEPQVGLSVGLVLHELATNAAKYGALSVPSGCVEVRWTVEDGPESHHLALEWKERGGPRVSPPKRRGFGTTLIERSLNQTVGGTVELDYRPEGLLCRIMLPLGGATHSPS
ncbi:sensor histidine kinase [Microvirga roseola]|uniref:sensor histidine kinase n=1 Tax=Microvirga roseola TaxID=2883126 RepID=UPI001E5D351A|nr:sensor histidine kinase [Microvirga roseola]